MRTPTIVPEWQGPVDRILAIWDAHHPEHQVVDIVLATMAFFDVIGDRELPRADDPLDPLDDQPHADRACSTTRAASARSSTSSSRRSTTSASSATAGASRWRCRSRAWSSRSTAVRGGARLVGGGDPAAATSSARRRTPTSRRCRSPGCGSRSPMTARLDELRAGPPGVLTQMRGADGNRRARAHRRGSASRTSSTAPGTTTIAIEHLEYVLRTSTPSSSFGGGQMEAVDPREPGR